MTNASEPQTTGKNFRARAKCLLNENLPANAVNYILWPWRKLYWYRRHSISPKKNARIAARIVASGRPIKLELGCWKRKGMEDWIASDWKGSGDIQLDLTKPLPFPDNSVEKIYSSHVLEHFSYPHPMRDLLSECLRILKPGGSFSVAVPNARIFINAYLNDNDFAKNEFCNYEVGLRYRSKIDYLNFVAYLGGEHKHMFDEEALVEVLVDSGFVDARRRDFDPSVDVEYRRSESIYAIAFKDQRGVLGESQS